MKKLFSLLVAGLVSFSVLADVVPRSGSLVLKVKRSEDKKSVSFEEWNMATGKLNKTLGAKKFYTYEEILEQRQDEALQPPVAVVGDLLLVVGVFISGGIAVRAIGMAAETYHLLLASGLGLVADGFIIGVVDSLNPMEQVQQHFCLRDEVILDKRVELETEEDVSEFIYSLETVLNKLDEGKLKQNFNNLKPKLH